ncbi:hypothetical protein CVV65_13470 [Kyrpidia spormannii]|uniref:Uncharacterized protein n=1 Tax=Kyrpidia spormannii TaxID=2055160 RepID=A0A2K8NB17_9BACL|nr:hypothetical protein [Kyrpidia spormannii]ATY85810.1 hypothetical protein CVV65_13470 [Kyrpidia spormannii]
MGTLTRSQKESIDKFLVKLFHSSDPGGESGPVPAPGRTAAGNPSGPHGNRKNTRTPERRPDSSAGKPDAPGAALNPVNIPGTMVQRILELWKVMEEDLASRRTPSETEKGMNYVVRATLSGVRKIPDLRDHAEGRELRQRVESAFDVLFRVDKKQNWENLSRLVERHWRPNQITHAEAVYFLGWLRRLLPRDRSQ